MVSIGDAVESKAKVAQREFDLIQDLLRTPLREDLSDEVLPDRRRWIGGCLLAVDRPDLIPFNPGVGPSGFCALMFASNDPIDTTKVLKVTVKNQGIANAGASETRVVFTPNDPALINNPNIINEPKIVKTDPIGIGKTVDIRVPFEQKFLELGFAFEIFVNFGSIVNESNMDNNRAEGRCDFPPDLVSIKHSGEQV